ncbi:hypothetical protein [Streptomyces sp. NPDC006415]|uniref:hypothetical protein n=1 Tax=Streptomyces sp. NPDC006415 TaxID=3155351 RepID=UPI0033A7228C
MDKGERERRAFNLIYDDSEYHSVCHSDSPDFLVRQFETSPVFGVEVTDAYETEADARIEQHPRYIAKLLDGARHMHKDDAQILPVVEVEVTDRDGNVKHTNMPAIIRPNPTTRMRAEILTRILRRKNERFSVYEESGVSHVNLVIMDHFASALNDSDEYLVRDLLDSDLRAELRGTSFREVYLVSLHRNGNSFYRPLRMLLLMEQFQLFLGSLNSYKDAEVLQVLEVQDIVPLFVRTTCGELGVRNAENEVGYIALLGNCGAFYKESRGTQILDFQDSVLPEIAPTPESPISDAEFQEFKRHHAAFCASNEFKTAMMLSVQS